MDEASNTNRTLPLSTHATPLNLAVSRSTVGMRLRVALARYNMQVRYYKQKGPPHSRGHLKAPRMA
jgi:hypothetical protein